MTEEVNVYAVSSGDYSDYSIQRVFATQELADEFIKANGRTPGDEMSVEVWPVEAELPATRTRHTVSYYEVRHPTTGEFREHDAHVEWAPFIGDSPAVDHRRGQPRRATTTIGPSFNGPEWDAWRCGASGTASGYDLDAVEAAARESLAAALGKRVAS